MVFKGLIAATAAVALAATPAAATASSAAAASTAAAQIAPAEESVEGSQLAGGFIIPLLAIVAIILGILAATGELEGDDEGAPRSP